MAIQQLVRSSSGMIHVEGCTHVAHYVDGQRERHGGGVLLLPEVERVDATTEIVRMVPDDSRFVEWVDARVTLETLTELGSYRRCSFCAPDVPEYDPATRYVSKEAGALLNKDVGRLSTLGRITAVTHTAGMVRVEVDGAAHELRADERLSFAITRRAGASPADTPQREGSEK